jgi:HK97 family phage prohead protease
MAAFPAKLRAELVDYNGAQRYHLTGHASVVNTPYEMWDSAGPYMEVIDAGAFTRTLAAGPDVAFLVNHRGVTMARTTNDSLRLSMDATGLAVEAWLNPKRQDVSDLVVAIEDRDVTEMSFAFMLGDGGGIWSADFQTFRIPNSTSTAVMCPPSTTAPTRTPTSRPVPARSSPTSTTYRQARRARLWPGCSAHRHRHRRGPPRGSRHPRPPGRAAALPTSKPCSTSDRAHQRAAVRPAAHHDHAHADTAPAVRPAASG